MKSSTTKAPANSTITATAIGSAARQHFPAVVGLPMAAVGAFIVVAVLQQSSGTIQFEALGLKFRGAAGQAMMWVICFLAIVIALKLVWSLS